MLQRKGSFNSLKSADDTIMFTAQFGHHHPDQEIVMTCLLEVSLVCIQITGMAVSKWPCHQPPVSAQTAIRVNYAAKLVTTLGYSFIHTPPYH